MAARRARKRLRPTAAGFTLVEVMVALLLTAIATSGIIGLYTVQTRSSSFSRRSTEATVLAQDELEVLRTSKVTGTGTTASLNEAGLVISGGVYTRSYNVVPGIGFDDITVIVSWDEDGVTRAVTLRTRRNQ